ncbi:MAG TPA: winged helix-turn-helix domain-containing protein [Devosia sp.]
MLNQGQETPIFSTATASIFTVGALTVRPAPRELEGPGGVVALEPRVMQVFLVLSGAGTEVVSRPALLAACWPGIVVGEDSLNRAVAELRKALRQADAGVHVETIAKTGYRLSIEAPHAAATPEPASIEFAPGDMAPAMPPLIAPGSSSRRSFPARRAVLLAMGAGAAWLGGWAARRWAVADDEGRAESLVMQAAAVMRDDRWGTIDPMVLLREAIRLRPRDAKAWGLYTLACRDMARSAAEPPAFAAISDCQVAAKRALALDPQQVDALTALATLEPFYANWLQSERRLLDLVHRFPDEEAPMVELADIYASTGRSADNLSVRERLAKLEPTSLRYALDALTAAFMAGDRSQQTLRLAHILQTWPADNAQIKQLQFQFLGFTGHPAQALDLVRSDGDPGANAPRVFSAQVAAFKALAGLDTVNAAVEACLDAARYRQSSAVQMIPLLAFLGAVDDAFAVADGYYLDRGPVKVPHKFGRAEPSIVEMRERMTTWLFVPTARSLWRDPRFRSLCKEIGLVDYWRSAGIRPDVPGVALP